MQLNQKPKITIDDDYLDLRDQSEIVECKKSSKGQKNICKKKKFAARTLNLQNEGLHYEKELINCGLRKLVTSYNNTANQHHRSYGVKRKNITRENTAFDPRFRRNVETDESRYLKSQSELSVLSGQKLELDHVSSSTPLFYNKKSADSKPKEIEPTRNQTTLTKKEEELEDIPTKKLSRHVRSRSRDFENNEENQLKRNIDPRLKDKYSILKAPWKRSWTIPVFASKYNLTNKNYCDDSDRHTYLYDEGSEIDSSYAGRKYQNFLKKGVPNQLMAILFVFGAACGMFLASILIYLIFGNNLLQIFFKPREAPEASLKNYFKFVGGGIIYVITSIVSTIGRILSIPTQNVHEPPIPYKWPANHLN